MVKKSGTRGSGKAKFAWTKTGWGLHPLTETQAQYLAELAQVRAKLYHSRELTSDQESKLEGRQSTIISILENFEGIEIHL